MPELEVVEVRTSELLPYANNAKIHTFDQVEKIAESIRQFGFRDPIGVWHNDDGEMEIVEGHGRLMALNKLGIETAPVIFLDHLTDDERRAYALVHNKLTMDSDFDYDSLSRELADISGIDMEEFGFVSGAPSDGLVADGQDGGWEASGSGEGSVDGYDDDDEEEEEEGFRCPYCGYLNPVGKEGR